MVEDRTDGRAGERKTGRVPVLKGDNEESIRGERYSGRLAARKPAHEIDR